MLRYIFILAVVRELLCTESSTEVQYLNELPLDKLLALKNSLTDLASTVEYNNATVKEAPHASHLAFGAQALAMKGPPIKRTDYEEGVFKKDGHSKISNIFTMSVTTLAFLAFGGYLLCLIVQAVKAKQTAAPPQHTYFVNAGIKRPAAGGHFASYGRRRRASGGPAELALPPDQLFSALLHFCEGYARWSRPERPERPARAARPDDTHG